ncbi:MAG: o-succinylbenzoate synthase [Candidatus Bipolaricaulia bacterium]
MRIERVELRHIEMPLVSPFETSFGRELNRQAILTSVESEGAIGWGECVASASPGYSYETVQTAWHVLRDFLVPQLLSHPLDQPSDGPDRWAAVRGHPMAKASLEAAVWDAYARLHGVSLKETLGGEASRIPSGISLGIQPSVDALLDRIDEAIQANYRRVKLKIKPGWDVEMLERVRQRFPELDLMVDANAAYASTDQQRLRALDAFGLMMIEQPYAEDDLVEHSRLQDVVSTPICLDESLSSPHGVQQALELDSCRIVNVKPGRVGGLTNARRIHDLCHERGVPVWCGGMLETGIGRAHNVALASLPGFTLPHDLSASERYYDRDVIEPPFELNADGTLSVPEGPGIGVEVQRDRIDEATRERAVFQP